MAEPMWILRKTDETDLDRIEKVWIFCSSRILVAGTKQKIKHTLCGWKMHVNNPFFCRGRKSQSLPSVTFTTRLPKSLRFSSRVHEFPKAKTGCRASCLSTPVPTLRESQNKSTRVSRMRLTYVKAVPRSCVVQINIHQKLRTCLLVVF